MLLVGRARAAGVPRARRPEPPRTGLVVGRGRDRRGRARGARPGYAGHAATGDFTIFAVPLDTIHVLAMSVWLGGLVVLLVAALGGGFSGGLRRALTTFSRARVLVRRRARRDAACSRRGARSGSRSAATPTRRYGNILLVKLAHRRRARRRSPRSAARSCASASRRRSTRPTARSPRSTSAPSPACAARSRVEVVLGLAVLAVTAMLVNAQPARSALDAEAVLGDR